MMMMITQSNTHRTHDMNSTNCYYCLLLLLLLPPPPPPTTATTSTTTKSLWPPIWSINIYDNNNIVSFDILRPDSPFYYNNNNLPHPPRSNNDATTTNGPVTRMRWWKIRRRKTWRPIRWCLPRTSSLPWKNLRMSSSITVPKSKPHHCATPPSPLHHHPLHSNP